MKYKLHLMAAALLAIAGFCSLAESVQAGAFADQSRDLILTFRKTGNDGGTVGTVVVEVDIGQASIYYGAARGSSIPITSYNVTSQLTGMFDSLNDLSWSIGGCVPNAGDSGDPTVPISTLWVTDPRQNPTIPASPAYQRAGRFTQAQPDGKINSILDNAATWAATVPADSVTNSSTVAAIPYGDVYNANGSLGGNGNYLGTFSIVENTTPATFSTDGTNSISDFYQLEPGSGPGTYLGYFALSPSGILTFYAVPLSYLAPTLSVSTAGSSNVLISFQSATNGTYTLHYITNAGGLTAPVSIWPTVSTNIIGDGTLKSFQQPISGTGAFYSVSVH